jgi:3-dehydroquinate synthetase
MQFELETARARKLICTQPSRKERIRPFLIGENWFAEMTRLIAEWVGDHMLVAVVDEDVAQRFPERIEALYQAVPRLRTIQIKGGEQAKTFATMEQIYNFMIENEFHRDDHLLALGGGAVGDVTGMVAATYTRGIHWINVPTTGISQIDCGVGGKSALNVGFHKNFCGTFYWPNVTMVDTTFLDALPERMFAVAIPVLAKILMVDDEPMYRKLQAAVAAGKTAHAIRSDLLDYTEAAIRVKSKVIGEDPYQLNTRQALLIGHTTAHALETASRLHLHHGEALSIGLAFESFIAEQRGLLDSAERKGLLDLLETCQLPTALPTELHDRLLMDSMRRAKRNRGRKVLFSLPGNPGTVFKQWPGCQVELPLDELWSIFTKYRMVHS